MADPWEVIGALSITAALLFFSFLHSVWKRTPIIQSLQSKHVLITGGSSGIGLEIAKESLAQGSYVTLISRNLVNLQKAVEEIMKEIGCNKDRINIKVADVRDYEAISAAINESFLWKPIDVLVSNAGILNLSYLEQQPIEWIDATVGTNLTGTLYTLRAALPLMKQRSYSHPSAIVFMGSVASSVPFYGAGLYASTKYAIKGLAETLRLELLPYNIGVTFVCPGFVETPLLTKFEDNAVQDPILAEVSRKVSFYDRRQAEDPREVAKATLMAAIKGEFLVSSGWMGLIMSKSAGTLPADTFAKAVLDMLILIPARLACHILIAHAYVVIWLTHQRKMKVVDVAHK